MGSFRIEMVVLRSENLIAGAPMATDGRINTCITKFVRALRKLEVITWYNKISYLSYSEGHFEARANDFARGSRTAEFWPASKQCSRRLQTG